MADSPLKNAIDFSEHGSSSDAKASWLKRKELAKGSVVSLFRAARGSVRRSQRHTTAEEERLGPRPVSRKIRAPAKSSVPVFDISEDVLDKLTSEPSSVSRRPTSKFFKNQRRRAGLSVEEIPKIPSRATTQAELDRRPLDDEDIAYMFAGAPYFGVEGDTGHRRPKVTQGWAPTLSNDYHATDHAQSKHKSFNARYIDTGASRRAREVPSMLSADGQDPGTTGFTHFLELPLRQAQYLNDTSVQRQHLLITDTETLGIRGFDIENIADRLAELARVYEMLRDGKGEAAEWDQRMIEEIGEDLFSTLLSADMGTTPAGTGSVSLRTQIAALQKVLLAEQVWFDFTDENWRTQLGQLMWQPRDVALFTNGSSINERDILLLQIALSAELAVRLEISQRLAASNVRITGIYAPGDFDVGILEQTEELDWDIVLFQRFIECFEAMSLPQGYQTSLRRMSYIAGIDQQTETSSSVSEEPDLVFQLRKEREQVDGLFTFASTLDWPGLNDAKTLAKSDSFLSPPPSKSRPDSWTSEYETPLSSPITSSARQGTPALVVNRSSKVLLVHSALEETLAEHGGGTADSFSWLAKTWFSGFIMPGAALNQILLHTLLETSVDTKQLLHESLNSNDGFVHKKQMYWSKDSVVGRVLASTAGAKECTGWISLPFVPQGQGDGWVQASTKDTLYATMAPRINSDLVSKTSDPLHTRPSSTLQAGDFATVTDGHPIMGNEAQFEGVSLTAAKVVQRTADSSLVPKTISLTFKSPRNPKLPPLTLPLTHAVYFASSYPCHPQSIPAEGSTSAHDSCAPIDSGRSTPNLHAMDKDGRQPPSHPLHVDYTYTIIPAAALLSSALPEIKDSDSLLLMDPDELDHPSIYQIEDEEVVVLDCRGSSDLEVLARAWCAKVGENALIGKVGRTCLACCIREAIGLGIGVVIRTL